MEYEAAEEVARSEAAEKVAKYKSAKRVAQIMKHQIELQNGAAEKGATHTPPAKDMTSNRYMSYFG